MDNYINRVEQNKSSLQVTVTNVATRPAITIPVARARLGNTNAKCRVSNCVRNFYFVSPSCESHLFDCMVDRTQVSNRANEVSQVPVEFRELKFLTVRQILCKIDPRSLRKTLEEDHIRRESCVWAFQRSSNIFPTIIIYRKCRLNSFSNCNHDIFFYWGSDVLHGVVTGLEIRSLLLQHQFGVPRHFAIGDHHEH